MLLIDLEDAYFHISALGSTSTLKWDCLPVQSILPQTGDSSLCQLGLTW